MARSYKILSPEMYEQFRRDVYFLKDAGHSNDEVIEIIYMKYGIVINYDQVKYYSRFGLPLQERVEKYEQENRLMQKWNNPTEEEAETLNYAEALFELANKNIDEQAFKELGEKLL